MKRVLLIGAASAVLSLSALPALADWLGEFSGSGSMYQTPRVWPNAAENYLGASQVNSPLREGRAAYEFSTYPQPFGPPVIAAPPADE